MSDICIWEGDSDFVELGGYYRGRDVWVECGRIKGGMGVGMKVF